MGQSSLLLSSRQGYYQPWQNLWDSEKVYTSLNIKSLLLQIFFKIFFQNKNFLNWRAISFNSVLEKSSFLSFWNLTDLQSLAFFLKNHRRLIALKLYISECWIFKYQKWFLCTFFFFSPKLRNTSDLTELSIDSINNFQLDYIFDINIFNSCSNKNTHYFF